MPITSGQILNGKFRVAFSQTPATSKSVASWSANGLPTGLSINSQTGLISGAPLVLSAGSPASLWPSYISTVDEHFIEKLSACGDYAIALNSNGELIDAPTIISGGATGSPVDSQANANIRDGITGATAISAGPWHLLAVTSSGGVVGILSSTADNAGGITITDQINLPSGVTGVTKVSAGWDHSLALKSNGTVVAFGGNGYGQSNVPAGLSGVVDIAAGHYFSVAVKSDGTVVHWGTSTLGTFDWVTDPSTLSGVASVVIGLQAFTTSGAFAVKTNGTVVRLLDLDGDLEPPTGLSNVTKIAVARNYVAALKSNGTVSLWGNVTSTTQATVETLAGIVDIGATTSFFLAQKTDGTVVSFKPSPVTSTFNIPQVKTELLRFNINVGPPIITASQSFSGAAGSAFSRSITFEDIENAPVTTVSVTGLPPGLTNSNETITGTPTTSGTFTITITATGSGGTSTGSATISISAVPAITSGQSFTGKVGVAFSQTPVFTNGPVTSWAVSSGALPSGLSLNTSNGAITGTPTALGTASPSLRATGAGGTSAATPVAFTISAGTPIIAPSQSFSGTVGTAFNQSISLTDSTNRPATNWVATGLPAGLSISAATGAITGTPTSAGNFTASATATGAGGTSSAVNVAFTIAANNGGGSSGGGASNNMLLAESQSFTATVGFAFNKTPQIIQGTATKWYATGLPGWATINASTGAIAGTPTFSGTSVVTVTAMDATGASATSNIFIKAVAFGALEIFVDAQNRKLLSKADTKSPLSKMILKRDDRIPFRVVFVDGTSPFAIPDSFSVSVGVKSSFSDTDYLSFSAHLAGTIDLSTEEVHDLFATGAPSAPAFFEVKWSDSASAIRTLTLPCEIQNSVIRGNDYSAVAYFGADAITTAAGTWQTLKAVGSPIFGIVKGNSYPIIIPPTARRVTIGYPASLGNIGAIRYAEFNNADITDTFAKLPVQVPGPSGTTIPYFVYSYIAEIPFGNYATYMVTI